MLCTVHTLYVQILDLKRVFYPGFERPVALTNRNKMSLIINVEAISEENVYGGGGGSVGDFFIVMQGLINLLSSFLVNILGQGLKNLIITLFSHICINWSVLWSLIKEH